MYQIFFTNGYHLLVHFVACSATGLLDLRISMLFSELNGQGWHPGSRPARVIVFCYISLWWRWRWALVSPDGVVPSRMVGVSASVIFPCTIKSRSFSSGTASPR